MRLMVLAASVAVVLVGVGCGGASESETSASTPTPTQTAEQAQGRWVIRDLGAGPATVGILINDRGQVVWHRADTWDPSGNEAHEFPVAFFWWNGRSAELTLGGYGSGAYAINERGQVVGDSENKTGDYHAFLWQNGKIRDLGTLGGTGGYPDSSAHAINERGQVVGSALTGATFRRGGVTYHSSHAFLWQRGKMRDLGTLGGPDSEAVAINERGQVVGWADTRATDKDGDPIPHAFLSQNGKMRDLGTLGGPSSRATTINERGQVIGSADTKAKDEYGDPIEHAFFWENGKMTDLGAFRASGINDRGQIVGTSAERPVHTNGFLWQNGTMRDLGVLSDPFDINERGQVVGSCYTSEFGSRACLWQSGEITGLGALPGGNGSGPYDINERGQGSVGVTPRPAYSMPSSGRTSPDADQQMP